MDEPTLLYVLYEVKLNKYFDVSFFFFFGSRWILFSTKTKDEKSHR